MFANLSGWHFLILLFIILLLFGAPKLPQLARSLGQSMRIFRGEMRQMKDDEPAASPSADAATGSTTGAAARTPAEQPQPVRPGDAERPQA